MIATSIITSGNIRCTRALSADGTVTVFPGQMADPTTQIACRKIWRRHFSVNIMQRLDLPFYEDIRSCLAINPGDFVSVGEIIAKTDGSPTRTLIAESSARFLGVSAGKLIFETDADDLEKITAGFPAIVSDIIPGRGAWLETVGSYLQGIWGNGKSGQGLLLSMDMEKGGIFSLDTISVDIAGAVVFANTCMDPEALAATVKMSPGGLIFGSLPSALLETAMKLPFPVIVTDQIGVSRLSNPVHMVLGENIIRFAYLYAPPAAGGRQRRPEIIIPQEEYIPEKENLRNILKIGDQVRVIEGFHGGEIGIVTALLPAHEDDSDPGLDEMPDRVQVRFDQHTEIVLPINNIEIINIK